MSVVSAAILAFAVVGIAIYLSWDYYVPDNVASLMLGIPIAFAIVWGTAAVMMRQVND